MIETFAALPTASGTSLHLSRRFVAIDDPSGVGKSTFTLRLARSLSDPPVVEMDASSPGMT